MLVKEKDPFLKTERVFLFSGSLKKKNVGTGRKGIVMIWLS